MKPYLNPMLAAIVAALVVSCYPYPEDPPPNRHQPNLKQAQQEAEAKARAEAKKKEEAAKKKAEEGKKPDARVENEDNLPKPNDTPPPTVPKTPKDWPVAKKIPGRDDQVLSPYNNQPVTIRYPDGRIIPSGKVVGDPSFQGDPTKRFVVP